MPDAKKSSNRTVSEVRSDLELVIVPTALRGASSTS